LCYLAHGPIPTSPVTESLLICFRKFKTGTIIVVHRQIDWIIRPLKSLFISINEKNLLPANIEYINYLLVLSNVYEFIKFPG